MMIFSEGDSDGCVRGKRYMYTPSDQGKFFKLLDVDSVLDVQVCISYFLTELYIGCLWKES